MGVLKLCEAQCRLGLGLGGFVGVCQSCEQGGDIVAGGLRFLVGVAVSCALGMGTNRVA